MATPEDSEKRFSPGDKVKKVNELLDQFQELAVRFDELDGILRPNGKFVDVYREPYRGYYEQYGQLNVRKTELERLILKGAVGLVKEAAGELQVGGRADIELDNQVNVVSRFPEIVAVFLKENQEVEGNKAFATRWSNEFDFGIRGTTPESFELFTYVYQPDSYPYMRLRWYGALYTGNIGTLYAGCRGEISVLEQNSYDDKAATALKRLQIVTTTAKVILEHRKPSST